MPKYNTCKFMLPSCDARFHLLWKKIVSCITAVLTSGEDFWFELFENVGLVEVNRLLKKVFGYTRVIWCLYNRNISWNPLGISKYRSSYTPNVGVFVKSCRLSNPVGCWLRHVLDSGILSPWIPLPAPPFSLVSWPLESELNPRETCSKN